MPFYIQIDEEKLTIRQPPVGAQKDARVVVKLAAKYNSIMVARGEVSPDSWSTADKKVFADLVEAAKTYASVVRGLWVSTIGFPFDSDSSANMF